MSSHPESKGATASPRGTGHAAHQHSAEFDTLQKLLEHKLENRSAKQELEARNVLKSARLRNQSIDFEEASSALEVHLKHRISSQLHISANNAAHAPSLPGTRVFVGNLPRGMKRNQLRKLFEAFGEVVDVAVIARKVPAFGFVTFAQPDQASKAIRELNGQDYKGRPLKVDISKATKQEDPPANPLVRPVLGPIPVAKRDSPSRSPRPSVAVMAVGGSSASSGTPASAPPMLERKLSPTAGPPSLDRRLSPSNVERAAMQMREALAAAHPPTSPASSGTPASAAGPMKSPSSQTPPKAPIPTIPESGPAKSSSPRIEVTSPPESAGDIIPPKKSPRSPNRLARFTAPLTKTTVDNEELRPGRLSIDTLDLPNLPNSRRDDRALKRKSRTASNVFAVGDAQSPEEKVDVSLLAVPADVEASAVLSRLKPAERRTLSVCLKNGDTSRAQALFDTAVMRLKGQLLDIASLSPPAGANGRPASDGGSASASHLNGSSAPPAKGRQGRRATIHASTAGDMTQLASLKAAAAVTAQKTKRSRKSPRGSRASGELSPVPSIGNVDMFEDDDELKSISNTMLILDRIRLERGLDQRVTSHIDHALQYLQYAQAICELRAAHIEKRMAKQLNATDSSPADAEVVQWISQVYSNTEKEDREKSRTPRTSSNTDLHAAADERKEKKVDAGNGVQHRRSLSGKTDKPVLTPATIEEEPEEDDPDENVGHAAAAHTEKKMPRSESGLGVNLSRVQKLIANTEVQEALRFSKEWNFDVFHLDDAAQGRPLCAFAMHAIQEAQLIDSLGLSRNKLINFFSAVEDGYRRGNPFHNNIHATDVTQNVYFFLQSQVMQQTLSPLDKLCAIMAASIHDVDHPARTNGFLAETAHPLALLYNDQSVLEHHHCSFGFNILQKPDNDVFSHFTRDERKQAREVIISMVLATDMRSHVHHLAEFEASIQGKRTKNTGFEAGNKEDRKHLLNMAIHCSDLANPAKPRYLYCIWVDRLMGEYYAQGDEEKALGLPISPMMDRTKPNVERSQVGFMDYVIKPMYNLWAMAVAEANVCVKHLEANYEYYSNKIPTAAPTTTGEPPKEPQPVAKRRPKLHNTLR